MRHEIADKQIEHYRERGFLVIEGFLSADELARWRAVTEEAVAERLRVARARIRRRPRMVSLVSRHGTTIREWLGKQRIDRMRALIGRHLDVLDPDAASLTNQSDPKSLHARMYVKCQRLADTSPAFRALVLDGNVGAVAGRLAGVAALRYWHDQALYKMPAGAATSWHLDVPNWSFWSADAVTVWVALDDMTLDNGCLCYLPGTHRMARGWEPEAGARPADLLDCHPQWRGIEPVACPCPAGSAVVHNGLTAHAAGANTTTMPRRAVACSFMPDGAAFNGIRDILPLTYFRTLAVGDVLRNDQVNPIAWRRIDDMPTSHAS